MKLWKLLIWTKYLVEIREMVFEKKYFEMFLAYFYYVAIISPIFASQVSDSLALIYPLADLVGFSKPSQ